MRPAQRTAAAAAIQENIESTLGAGIHWAGVVEAQPDRLTYTVNALTVGGRGIGSDTRIIAGSMNIRLVSHPIAIVGNVAGRPDALTEVMSAPADFDTCLLGEDIYDVLARDLNQNYPAALIADSIACRAARNEFDGLDQSRWVRSLILVEATREMDHLPSRAEFAEYIARLSQADEAMPDGVRMDWVAAVARMEPFLGQSQDQIQAAIRQYRGRFGGEQSYHLAGRQLLGVRALVEAAYAGFTAEIQADIRNRVAATGSVQRQRPEVPAPVETVVGRVTETRVAARAVPVQQVAAPAVPVAQVTAPTPVATPPVQAEAQMRVLVQPTTKRSKAAKAKPKQNDDFADAFSF